MLEIFRSHGIDGLTIHGRTVNERYQTPVHPDCVRLAVETMPCPVIANGNIVDVVHRPRLFSNKRAPRA